MCNVALTKQDACRSSLPSPGEVGETAGVLFHTTVVHIIIYNHITVLFFSFIVGLEGLKCFNMVTNTKKKFENRFFTHAIV